MNYKKMYDVPLFFILGIIFYSCNEGGNTPVGGAIKLECSIVSNQTLSNHNTNGIDYYADCDVSVSGGTLTIEPGTSIMFKNGAGISISGNGSIRAIGTASDRITFAGETSISPWQGLTFTSASPLNELSFCDIKGGGSVDNFYSSTVGGTLRAAISIEESGRLTMNNCLVNGSAAIGVAVDQGGQLAGLSNCSFTGCVQYPLLIGANSLTSGLALGSCSFTGNQVQKIAIFADGVESNVTINAAAIPYIIVGLFRTQGAANLTINQGVTIHALAGTYLQNDGTGYFDINGTSSQPVIIRGDVSVAGFWHGIIVNSNSPLNVFEYLQISDGGSTANCFAPDPTNIQVGCVNTAQLTLNNCSSTNYGGCQVAYSTTDGILINNSPDITNVCAY